MVIPLSFTRRLYLINHHPVDDLRRFQEISFSKFVTLQTINEFKEAVYNDLIAGDLYEDEKSARVRLKSDEYYMELSVPIESISHRVQDGHIYINRGYTPVIKSLKTAAGEVYTYDTRYGFEKQEPPKMRFNSRLIYGYNPSVWELRTETARGELEPENLH